MLTIRPYNPTDAATILSWCQEERAFYQWTAGVMGEFPITQKEFAFVENLIPFIAFDEDGIVGFFTSPFLAQNGIGFRLIRNHILKPDCFIAIIGRKVVFKNSQRCSLRTVGLKSKF